MNFKGVQTLWKKSGKFSKILSQYDLYKSEFSWAHLNAKIGVLICDRTTSEMRGLSPKIISGDSRRS
jgi:hypothetical protein